MRTSEVVALILNTNSDVNRIEIKDCPEESGQFTSKTVLVI